MTREITWRPGLIFRSFSKVTFIERTYAPNDDGEPPITRCFDFEIEGVMREASGGATDAFL